jgi:tetratricopeptide (TPR) repeat protein
MPDHFPDRRRRSRLALLVGIGATLLTAPALAQSPQSAGVTPVQGNPARQFGTAETASGNYLAALAASAARDTAAAKHFFREALREDRRNVDLEERSFIAAVQDGAMADAFGLAERVLRRDPQNALAHLVLGIRALKNRQFQTARAALQKAGGRGRNADVSSTLLVAWTYVGSGDLKRALETVDRLREPELAIYRNFYGGMMAQLGGDRREAEKRLKAAYAADGSPVRVADAYARFEARFGDKEAAKAVYAKVAERPGQKAFVAEAMQALEAGKVPEPFAPSVAEGAAEVLFTASDTGVRQGGEVVALIYLQLARHLSPDSDIILVSLAESYESLKQYDRAVDLYRRVPDTSGIRNRAVMRAASAMNEQKQLDQALKLLDEQIAKDPKDVQLHETVAALHRGAKNWKAAAEASSKAIALVDRQDKRYWSVFYGRGIAYERGKEWPLAEADLKHALTLLPENPTTEGEKAGRAHVLNHLAYSWVDMGMHIQESFVMLKRAVELQPRDGYIIDSLGWAYYKLGQFENAVTELEKAVDLKPSDPVLNDHLGDAYWKVGRVDEAKFQWNHARDLKPEPDELAKILRKIDKGLDAAADAAPPAAEGEKKPSGG